MRSKIIRLKKESLKPCPNRDILLSVFDYYMDIDCSHTEKYFRIAFRAFTIVFYPFISAYLLKLSFQCDSAGFDGNGSIVLVSFLTQEKIIVAKTPP